MTPERWKLTEEIFNRAIELPPEERASFLDESCGTDSVLREQVEYLIRCDADAESFIATPAIDMSGIQTLAHHLQEQTTSMTGRRIGAYRVLREIGRGGMGAVFLAARDDEEFQRRVAIKLVKRGMDTDDILRRFRNERQILANLDHPNVARLLDGGTTEDGLPYFVMEYIQGKPIHHFCDERRLTVAERLELFRQVCAALAYAHRNRVVHRDIKPSNILVTRDGTPKLLDFGIAKLLGAQGADGYDPTITALRMMTPKYASPEQLDGEAGTPLSDIYSLGVLLYEIITGRHPFRVLNCPPHEVARRISEGEPEAPTVAIRRIEESAPATLEDEESARVARTPEEVAHLRSTTLDGLRRELSRGLDRILLKAMSKEPAARYASVEEFAADVERCLAGQPVVATMPVRASHTQSDTTAPGVLTAAAKVRWAALVLALVAFISILSGVGVYLYFERAQSARTRVLEAIDSIAVLPFDNVGSDADTEYLSDGITEHLINHLAQLPRLRVMARTTAFSYKGKAIDPRQAGREMGVGAVLVGEVTKRNDSLLIRTELVNVADGSRIWGDTYRRKLADLPSVQQEIAGDMLNQLRVKLSGLEQQQLARRYTDNTEAYQFYLQGEYERHRLNPESLTRSIGLFEQAIAREPDYALAYVGLALSYRALPAFGMMSPREAFPRSKEAASKALALDPQLATAYIPLASIKFVYDWDFDEAESSYRQAIALSANDAEARSSYANFLTAMGRYDEALREYRIAGQLDPLSLNITSGIAWSLYVSGRYDEALEECQKILAREPRHARTLQLMGEIYGQQRKFDEAVTYFQKAKEISGEALNEAGLGYVYAAAGRRAEALRIVSELETRARRGDASPFLPAVVYAGLGQRDEAFAWLDKAFAERSNWMPLVKTGPRLATLRSDPRFEDLLRRIGFKV